jgi:hypothetical protein
MPLEKKDVPRPSGLSFVHRNDSDGRCLPESAPNMVRAAGCVFVKGTASGWSRRDLATWLLCHYAPATARAGTVTAQRGLAFDAVDDMLLEEIVLDARNKTLRLLADLAFPSLAATRARDLIAQGSVTRVTTEGSFFHAPVSLARLRLHERVESLFVADWLNFPSDYRSVELCRACGALGFARARPPHDAWCPRLDAEETFNLASA